MNDENIQHEILVILIEYNQNVLHNQLIFFCIKINKIKVSKVSVSKGGEEMEKNTYPQVLQADVLSLIPNLVSIQPYGAQFRNGI